MMARTLVPLLALALVSTARPALAGDTLDQVRDEVKGDDDSSKDEPEKRKDPERSRGHGEQRHGNERHQRAGHRYEYDDADGDGDALGAELALAILAAPFWLPHLIAGDEFGRPAAFARYPYADRHGGLLLSGAGGGAEERNLAAWVSLEGAYRDDGLWRAKVDTRLHGAGRFGLAASYAMYFEPREGQPTDTLGLGDAELLFTFAQSEHALFYTGAGGRLLTGQEPRFGFDWVYGFDIFITRPLVFSARFDLGSLGKAFVAAASARLGFVMGRLDVGVGYDTTAIGDTQVGGVTLGVRTWL